MLQFIKIGQQFSTRVDVLSPEFVKELEKLQVGLAWLAWLTWGVWLHRSSVPVCVDTGFVPVRVCVDTGSGPS